MMGIFILAIWQDFFLRKLWLLTQLQKKHFQSLAQSNAHLDKLSMKTWKGLQLLKVRLLLLYTQMSLSVTCGYQRNGRIYQEEVSTLDRFLTLRHFETDGLSPVADSLSASRGQRGQPRSSQQVNQGMLARAATTQTDIPLEKHPERHQKRGREYPVELQSICKDSGTLVLKPGA